MASGTERGSIEREIHIDAGPEVVYEVISRPEHLREWWPDEAEFKPVPGASGAITFGHGTSAEATVVPLTVVEADPPRRFSFRWVHDQGEAATPANSLLVTFDLIPAGEGTLVRFTETGFREKGWEAAVLEEQYREHVTGWDHFLPRLVAYVARVVSKP
ncbi:SRPBCC family protein [Streptomyces sp. NPDC056632]|uniref:SRPBCC family protein n=1 Tax=unclassified Streptomyces TaxID=2593676 RepID=UPI0036C0C815